MKWSDYVWAYSLSQTWYNHNTHKDGTQEECGPEEEGREMARGAVYSEDGRSRSELGKGVASRS